MISRETTPRIEKTKEVAKILKRFKRDREWAIKHSKGMSEKELEDDLKRKRESKYDHP